MKFIAQSLFFIFLVFCSISCGKANVEVAGFDGGVVTKNELSQIIGRMSVQELDHLQTKEDYFRFVRKIALEQIILKEANESGLLDVPEVQKKLASIRRNTAFEILHKRNVLDKIKVVEGDYAKYSTIYELYHIVCRTNTLKNEKIEQSRKLLKRLSTEIKTLDDFMACAKKYSEDATSYDGGYVGRIRLGIMDSAIDQVL
ncbi:MAG: peptidylprolyl isomerase, partial [Spirochaetales bacterium]|nr:peptidylprolyl isomerase [Spirochaetales bacterium]